MYPGWRGRGGSCQMGPAWWLWGNLGVHRMGKPGQGQPGRQTDVTSWQKERRQGTEGLPRVAQTLSSALCVCNACTFLRPFWDCGVAKGEGTWAGETWLPAGATWKIYLGLGVASKESIRELPRDNNKRKAGPPVHQALTALVPLSHPSSHLFLMTQNHLVL